MTAPRTKRCPAPGHQGERKLPLTEFQADATSGDGHKSHCRACRVGERKRQTDRNVDKNSAKAEREVARAEKAALKLAAKREAEQLELEREISERERRLADDFAPLRVDDLSSDADFATGVANRQDLTKAQRRQASAEKRQEYSAAMGDHAREVRAAAVKGGELAEHLSSDDGAYIGTLAEQERRFGNRRLARSVSLFSAGEELARQLWIRACRQYLTGRVVATGYAARPAPETPLKRSVCLMLSDLHLGADLTASENPIPFRKVEEARRLEYILRQVLDYKPQHRKDSELVLMFNGDNIEGLLLHDFRDGSPMTEQKVIFQRYFERFVAECARAFKKVRIYCQPGNHGRDKVRHPGRATSSKWDGHEVGMYYALARACSNLKNVTWEIPFRAVSSIDLHGSWFLLSHGDTEVKLGDPDTKAKDNLAILDKINATQIYGREYAAAGFGHFHKPRYLPSHPRVLFNGALVPPNGHARGAGYIGESCGQWLWESVEGYPVGDVRFIEVGPDQDHDDRLGTIIEPFRFDLDVDAGLPV